MRLTALTLWLALTSWAGFAQKGKIEGKITDSKTGQAVAGISVVLNGTQTGVSSNTDGYFVIAANPGKQSLSLSSTNYQTKKIDDIDVIAGQVTHLDIVMDIKVKSGEAVVVKATSAKKETVNALISYQRTAPVVAQVMSAEAIRRSPDKNTGEVLKRVPGTSVQEGKYLVVRGLNDRYNQAMLNGVLLSSTEPDRKTFSFDIFPAGMIDNIIMNKSFVPELPGEWAGGLVQVNTKEIPAANFLTLQVGTGFNSQTIGQNFLQYRGGKLDWLGLDDGTRGLPANIPTKSKLGAMTQAEQNEYGKQFRNVWAATPGQAPLNASAQLSGGFAGKLFGKKIGGTVALTYNQSNRRMRFDNAVIANNDGTLDLEYNNNRYSRDVLAGALANFSLQLNSHHRISFKNIINVNSSDFVVDRFDGRDFILGPAQGDKVRAQELGLRQNIFYNTQLMGEHNLPKAQVKFKWYGSFNILDQYIPDQRRLFYTQDENNPNAPFFALLGAGSSQKSGSLFYSFLSDYIYNAGADLSKSFSWKGLQQTVKVGYLLQIKDRLFDSRPFFINTLDNGLRQLPADQIFAAANFGTTANSLQFGELSGKSFRYMANTIMNAGYIQFDNQLSNQLRLVWGVRLEDFDQLVGSPRRSDERHVYSRVTDFLPGLNLTWKTSGKTNLRLGASQTVVRPEFRELSPFAFYDFELNAQVVGNSRAQRTKVTNLDLRYEWYPRAGELFTVGLFYKYFNKPIEYYFNRTGPATNTFNINNSDRAQAYGVELEFRKKLTAVAALKNFTVTGNLSYIYSKVQDTAALSRPLQGQSPYLINLGLQYDWEKAGFSSILLFNQIGRRILFVGNEAVSDIWEAPRPLVDLQLAKKLLKGKGEVRVNISDLLNRPANFYHDLNNDKKYASGSKDVLAIRRIMGTNYSITFGYTLK
jgi:outer membrane receptor protein involved in Fe transport